MLKFNKCWQNLLDTSIDPFEDSNRLNLLINSYVKEFLLFNKIATNIEYQIFDFTGKIIKQGTSSGNQIAVNNLNSNYYLVQYSFDNLVVTNKFFKE